MRAGGWDSHSGRAVSGRAGAIIPPMTFLHALRNTPWLAKLALLWFALTMGAAVASPVVKPQTELVICTGAGMLKVVLTDDGTVTSGATADTSDVLVCPLCLLAGAPLSARFNTTRAPRPLGHVLPHIPAAHIAALTAAPPPARGPPTT